MTFDPDDMRLYVGPYDQLHPGCHCKAWQSWNKEPRLGLWIFFLSPELVICHSFFQGQMRKAALTDYLSSCKPLYYLKKGTRNLPFSSAYRRSFLAFASCWLELFQYHKCLFEIAFQLTLFRWRGGRGVGKKAPITSFSLGTSRNIGISPQNFLTFSFNPFPHRCKIWSLYLVLAQNYWTWTKTTPQKKQFFWSNP